MLFIFSYLSYCQKGHNVIREPMVNHMVEEHIATKNVDETYFLDINIDSFKAKPLVLKKSKVPTFFS